MFKVKYKFAGASGSYGEYGTQAEAHAAQAACVAHFNKLSEAWIEKHHPSEGKKEYKIELTYAGYTDYIREIRVIKADNARDAFVKVLELVENKNIQTIDLIDRF